MMNQRTQQLFRAEMGDVKPDICIRSKARIDTGLWCWRSPMWLCVVGEELVMLAIARRRYFARKSIADCSKCHYNHATGEFVVESEQELQFNKFPMPPRDALRLLSYIKKSKSFSQTV